MISPDPGFPIPRKVDLVLGLDQSKGAVCDLYTITSNRELGLEGKVEGSFLFLQSEKRWNSVSIYSTNIY